MGTILFSIDVQKDFAMIADEDAKDKLSAINEGKNTHDSLGRESESLWEDWTIKLSSLVLFKLSRARLCYFWGLF